jgi:MoxR-like ATPase
MTTELLTKEINLEESTTIRSSLLKFLKVCHTVVIGRDKEINMAMCALLSQSNLMLLGSPGEGKSFMAHTFRNNIVGAKSFFKQLSPETDMDEIFGSPKFDDMQAGRIRRNIEDTLVDSDIAFLDEIGKANSALRESMFTVLNERMFVNGTQPIKTPLMTCIAAANEVNTDSAGFNSRFHIKLICNKLTSPERFELLSRRAKNIKMVFPDEAKLDIAVVKEAQRRIKSVIIPDHVIEKIIVCGELLNLSSDPDSRKLEMSIDVIKASVYLQKRTEATVKDLNILKNILWDDPNHYTDVSSIVDAFIND